MKTYSHGGNIYELGRINQENPKDYLDFSANINPLGMSCASLEALKSYEAIGAYPDIEYEKLKKAIGSYEGIDFKNVFLGNGAVELFFYLVNALKAKKALIVKPTFIEYERACGAYSCRVETAFLKEDNGFKVNQSVLDKMDENLDLMFLCHPNNPTGQLIAPDVLEAIVKKANALNIALILDESFLEFVPDGRAIDGKIYLDENNRVVVVKSLTKFFAIPGLRLGYCLTKNKAIINRLYEVSPPWRINVLAERVGQAILKEVDYIEETVRLVEKENKWLFSELSKIEGIKPYPSTVNFILFKWAHDKELWTEMLAKKIILRACHTFEGLGKAYYRVAVKGHDDNDVLVTALKKIGAQVGK